MDVGAAELLGFGSMTTYVSTVLAFVLGAAVVIGLLAFGGLLVTAQSSALGPFIYTLF